jgi:hypothetical protein
MRQFSSQSQASAAVDWFLSKGEPSWDLVTEPSEPVSAQVTIPQELAWRVFTKGIDHPSALNQMSIAGDRQLGIRVLNLIAVIA